MDILKYMKLAEYQTTVVPAAKDSTAPARSGFPSTTSLQSLSSSEHGPCPPAETKDSAFSNASGGWHEMEDIYFPFDADTFAER